MKKLWLIINMSVGLQAFSAGYLCLNKFADELISIELSEGNNEVKVLLHKKNQRTSKKTLKSTLYGKKSNESRFSPTYKLKSKTGYSASLKMNIPPLNKFPDDHCKYTALGCEDPVYNRWLVTANLYSATDSKNFNCHFK